MSAEPGEHDRIVDDDRVASRTQREQQLSLQVVVGNDLEDEFGRELPPTVRLIGRLEAELGEHRRGRGPQHRLIRRERLERPLEQLESLAVVVPVADRGGEPDRSTSEQLGVGERFGELAGSAEPFVRLGRPAERRQHLPDPDQRRRLFPAVRCP